MTGLARRTGWPVRVCRTGIEVLVLGAGWLLGGSVGVGTVLYALAIGPLVQLLLPRFTVPEARPVPAAGTEAAGTEAEAAVAGTAVPAAAVPVAVPVAAGSGPAD
jgi:hypothetical protein